MPSFILFLLLLSCTPALSQGRRILHQPFLPQDSSPPIQSPSPPIPQLPSSSSTPNQSPFFPSYPSSPPPPPSNAAASTTTSEPANISSLAVPRSPKPRSSSGPILVAAAVISAALLLSAAAFFYCRRKRSLRHSAHHKPTFPSDVHPNVEPNGAGRTRKSRDGPVSGTSSDFLYLGTLVNSHAHHHHHHNHNNNSVSGTGNSPELRPLPPLAPMQSFRQSSRGNADGEGDEDEEEEFYSPRGSSGGRDSSVFAAGSASGRANAAIPSHNFRDRGNDSSSSSYSSSTSASPTRSISVSISPPVSLSPRSSRPKSPDLVAVQTLHPPRYPSPPLPPPPPPLVTPFSNRRDISSPSLSSSRSSSPVRVGLDEAPDASSTGLTASGQNLQSPLRMSGAAPKAISVPWPPPPPPPPRPLPGHSVSSDPYLQIPDPVLRPFKLHDSVKASTMELSPSSKSADIIKIEETPKPRLKPLHWDKVRASSDREMVWDQLKSSSFKLNEEMIETLFVVNTSNLSSKEALQKSVFPSPNQQENRVLDPKKSQNIAILLRALNVTIEEVCEALLEGNTGALGTDLLESLLKMAPTKEEERKLKEYKDDSPFKLGPAERFLKAVLDIPFAFKRVNAMLYIANFESEVEYLRKSFETLEAACDELRNSRMFLKLLEAVLKTGNRMNVGTNRGDAHAFKLDTLLKLVDVKGADGKTTLLHFVVQEIVRTEGARLCDTNQIPKSTFNEDARCRKLGLQVVAGLSSELSSVKKAAAMDSEVLCSELAKLSRGIRNIEEVMQLNDAVESEENINNFFESMGRFLKFAEGEIIRIQAQESVALSLVKEITEYFHGNSMKEEAHPFRIFLVVRDFLTILDRVCKEVGLINERTIVSFAHKFPVPVNPMLAPAFSEFNGRQHQDISSDEGKHVSLALMDSSH